MKKLLIAITILVALVLQSHGQGTIQFVNTTLTRINMNGAPGSLYVGLYYKASEDATWQGPAEPLGLASAGGIISTPNGNAYAYALPGTEPGRLVYLQAYAWDATYGTDPYQAWLSGAKTSISGVAQLALGPTSGPGTVLWSNSDPTRLRPLAFPLQGPYPAPPVVPEPSTLAFAALGGLVLFMRRRA